MQSAIGTVGTLMTIPLNILRYTACAGRLFYDLNKPFSTFWNVNGPKAGGMQLQEAPRPCSSPKGPLGIISRSLIAHGLG